MNEDFLKKLQDSAEDAEIINDDINFLKRKFQEYFNMYKGNSTKRGKNHKTIKARRKKNKNKKTHRK